MSEIQYQDKVIEIPDSLPLLPLRDVVVFPAMIHPLLVGRPGSVSAVEEAMLHERLLMVATQKDKDVDQPTPADIYRTGTLVQITQLLRLPDGTMKILGEGIVRARIVDYRDGDDYFRVSIDRHQDDLDESEEKELQALIRSLEDQFREYVGLNKRVPDGVLMSLEGVEDPRLLADTIATHIPEKIELKQAMLEESSPSARLRILLRVLTEEMEILKLERRIETEVKSQVQRNQREFYLNEQLKAIRRELGHDEDEGDELDEMAARGITGLWLIGVWQRSRASRDVKQRRGNTEALASAYAVDQYRIADDLGGEAALDDLRHRAIGRRSL